MTRPVMIDIHDLSFQYPDGTPGLDSLNLRVYAGECLGIVGPNGAGKSTLLLHLNGVRRGRGTVRVAGLRVARNTLAELRSRVGMVFQNPDNQLFMPTLMDDVLFGPLNFGMSEAAARVRAEEVLGELGLWEKRDRSPLHFSLGEKKKAALATVLVMDPPILVLDEPLVSLDPGSRRRMLERIRRLRATKIIATHDLEMVAGLCGRAVLMNHGRVLAEGVPGELLSRGDLLEAHDLEVPPSLRGSAGL